MTKRGPLSKAEKYYIQQHTNMDIDDLCKDLDRAKVTVEKYMKYMPKDSKNKSKTRKSETLLSKQFARNEKGGATVMTPNASIMADEKRSQFNGAKNARPECITRVRDDE